MRERVEKREDRKKERRAGDTYKKEEREGKRDEDGHMCLQPAAFPNHGPCIQLHFSTNRNADPWPRPLSQPINFQISQSIPDSLYNTYPETKQHRPATGVLGKTASALKRHNEH